MSGRHVALPRSWKIGRTLCALCALLFAITDHASSRDLRPGIFGSDDRKVIEPLHAPWAAAIGQVNVAGYRRLTRCTGSLIEPNLVITAAHCVMDPWIRKPFPLHQIHFVAGVKASGWLGHSTAKCLHFPSDYEYVAPKNVLSGAPLRGVPRRALLRDVVLIVLKDDLQNISPVELISAEQLGSATFLVHASYAADHRYALTAQFGCRLLARDQRLLLTDCDTHAASSGGPVFIQTKDGLKLAAIMVGIATGSASIAVPAADWFDLNEQRHCP